MVERTEEEPRKLWSKDWGHFIENKPAKHIKCKLSEAHLSFHGGTMVMNKHLKSW